MQLVFYPGILMDFSKKIAISYCNISKIRVYIDFLAIKFYGFAKKALNSLISGNPGALMTKPAMD